MQADEGVILFDARHQQRALEARRFGALAAQLAAWRQILASLGVVGQDPERYGGAGYGNVSGRVGPFPGARRARPFLVTGTQTSGQRCVGLRDFCLVSGWEPRENRVESEGEVLPSSESLTHGALYDLAPHIRFVLHAHAPQIWTRRRQLGLPETSSQVGYGTPAMAREVERLWRETTLPERQVLAMGGHEDGVIAFGRTTQEAGAALLSVLASAHECTLLEDGELCDIS
jgi:hypothetical protein